MVGRVRGVHGLRGAVRIEPLSDDLERFAVGATVYREGDGRPLTVEWVRRDGPGLLTRFREVATRKEAEEIRERYLEADVPADLLDEGEYYWHEIVGVPVTTTSGEALGSVVDVFRAGGGEVYVVRGGPRGEVLVPAIRSVIVDFHPRESRLIVDEGAMGLEEVRAPRPRGRRTTKGAPRP